MGENNAIFVEEGNVSLDRRLYRVMSNMVQVFFSEGGIRRLLRIHDVDSFILYGASEVAWRFIQMCDAQRIKVTAVSDVKIVAEGENYLGIPLIPKMSLVQYLDSTVIITSLAFYDEIFDELKHIGVKEIISIEDLLRET